MRSVLQALVVFVIAKKLITRITNTKAYKLGIVNEKGNRIRKPKTKEEKDAYTIVDRFVFNLKSLIGERILLALSIYMLVKEDEETLTDKFLNEEGEVDREKVQENMEYKKRAQETLYKLESLIEESGFEVDEFFTHCASHMKEDGELI